MENAVCDDSDDVLALLQAAQWLVAMGEETACEDIPQSWLVKSAEQVPHKSPDIEQGQGSGPVYYQAKLPGKSTPAVLSPAVLSPAVLSRAKRLDSARQQAAKAGDIATLDQLMANFRDCDLVATANRAVFGSDLPVPACRLMVILESPGTEDDRSGMAFSGPEGRLLARMLGSIDHVFTRENTSVEEQSLQKGRGDQSQNQGHPAPAYCAYLSCWRPPGGRSLTATETDILSPFLHQRIKLAKPDYVLLMGARPAAALRPNSPGPDNPRSDNLGPDNAPLSRLVGKWSKIDIPGGSGEIPALVTYSPAYLLRTPLAKRQAWLHLQNLSAHLSDNDQPMSPDPKQKQS